MYLVLIVFYNSSYYGKANRNLKGSSKECIGFYPLTFLKNLSAQPRIQNMTNSCIEISLMALKTSSSWLMHEKVFIRNQRNLID